MLCMSEGEASEMLAYNIAPNSTTKEEMVTTIHNRCVKAPQHGAGLLKQGKVMCTCKVSFNVCVDYAVRGVLPLSG